VSPKPISLLALGSIAIEERRRPGRKLMFWLGSGWQLKNSKGIGLFAFATELSARLREARIELWSATQWPILDSAGRPSPVSEYVDPKYLSGANPEPWILATWHSRQLRCKLAEVY
jgi:hypothetical protein